MLPKHIAAALVEGRKIEPIVRDNDHPVTIFFSDIVGNTFSFTLLAIVCERVGLIVGVCWGRLHCDLRFNGWNQGVGDAE
jgi:hypothetical protein